MKNNKQASVTDPELFEVRSAIDKTVLEMISSGAPLSDVLNVLCRIIEEQSPGLLCSILLLDPDRKTLRHGAAPSLPDSYIRAIDGIAIGPSAGSCGTAAYLGEPVNVSDIASDPLWAEYRDLALSHGLQACWSTPILSGDSKVLGTFAMYYREPRSPSSCDLQVIERATHLATIAIERERAEQALRQAENRYRSIIENAVEGFFQTTPSGGYVSLNPALARMYGYESPTELMSAVRDIGGQVYVDSNRRAEFKRVMEEHGLVQGFEYQVYRKDGTKIWLLENARVVRDANGEALYYEGTVVDITERRRAEAERQVMFEIVHGLNTTANLDELLRLIHQSLKRVLFAENFFVALYDRESGLFTFPFFVDQFDTSPPPQKLEKSCMAYVFRTGRPIIITQKLFDQLAEQDEVDLVGTPSPTWLGVPLKTPEETIGVLVVQHYEDGGAYTERELAFLASVGTQIAVAIERKQAEEKLRAAETRFRTLVEQLPAITYIAEFGAADRWSYVSPQIESLLGFAPTEWIADAEAWVKHLHPDDRGRVLGEEERSQQRGEPFCSEYRMIARDGRILWCRDEATMMRDQAGKRTLRLGVIYDISERRQLEGQLRQAQKMEAVGGLAGGVAHDFNNLLMVIKGNSEVMLEYLGPTERLRKNADQINKATDKASSLTRQLLAFSRMQVLQPKLLDLNAVVVEMGKMLRRLISEDIELNIVSGASLGAVKADQGQIEQVIMNLAINARDAMPQGGTLTIETANVFLDEGYARRHAGIQPGKYVMIAVSDTGVGMDAETQAHCFEPFFTTKELGKGTGLGLATVYGVIKQSGGWIWVYSEPGRGTTFKTYLPQVEEVVGSTERSNAVSAPLHGSETILLVEDQEGIRELATEFLKGRGYTVLEAKDGSEALQVAEQHVGEIDLLITDVVMPRMGGPELVDRLAASRPRMKVTYMSGYAQYAGDSHKLAKRDEVSLQKPFALDTLARKVREVLDADGHVTLPPK